MFQTALVNVYQGLLSPKQNSCINFIFADIRFGVQDHAYLSAIA